VLAVALTFRIKIDAPAETVFDELSHVERHPSWANPKAKMTMSQSDGDGPGPNARYRSSGVFVGKQVTADIAVTAYDPPRRFSIRSDQHQEGKKDVWYENSYALTPSGGGTELAKTVTSNGNAFVAFLARPAIKKDAMTSLRNLKALVERTS
jgi:uncharacterized protein YndB with AHSA1/START domain